ncbi:MAG: ATP-dependent RNA helicase HrpA [Pseudomonadota bacterium]|nr:ATP-dependent RNA helicase HrpA [Pseudomonadota bacterium]
MPNEGRLAAARGVARLVFKHDADLPISALREEFSEALRRHPVLIVAGDTGSGKSTQLPQYCLEAGRGVDGLIAHTQPRRLAARALAARIAEELAQPVGGAVGFRVRFADQASEATRLVLMTDGLLLAELSSDPLLRRYDTIIVDEAHERTLNVDLLLGVLKRLLPRRPELKLIVTSATLDVERVARFFDDAPIIAVSGRSHPIEVRYAADEEADDPDLPLAVLNAYQDIATTPGPIGNGDVLVFLPGEREIRDVGDFLQRELGTEVDVLGLYSRLSWDQQSRIFQRGPRRRVVLATNVAETSITVPGIRAVIDSGLARISRYSPRNRLQRLPIERVSRASAEQRKGRCGRLGPGLCVRLYSEVDFEARAAFTEPEVLRTNLAALLLRLAADGLGEAETFPFIDAPDSRSLGDGYRLLQELEALDAERRITRRGRSMSRLPLDPRLARALLESKRFHAESELLAIVAGLSVPDARLADSDGAGEASPAAIPAEDRRGEDSKSEFSSLVRLWRAYRKAREGSRRELRRWCKEQGLSLLRLSEWEDVYGQVADRAAELGIVAQRRPASYTGVHRALLAGFCTMVGVRGEDGVYLGTRGIHFHIFPGSPLKRRRPRWVMAANIVETSRVFARRVAEIEPMWVEAAAQHLVKREFLEPDWDEAREEVVARERISFLGLVLSANRVVNYGPIAPEESRLIFAREALVYHRLRRRPEWLRANDDAIRAAQRTEERLRTRDLLHPPEFFVEFYDKALPRQVSSAATLEYFTRHLGQAERAALTFRPEDVFARPPDQEQLARFPECVTLPETAPHTAVPHLRVPVQYRFAPGEAGDGATLRIPLLALPTLTRASVDAAVPGLAQPRVEALLRSLPKEARRSLIPIGAAAASFMEFVGAPSTNVQRLADWLRESRGIPSALIRFDLAAVPAHLTAQLAVIEDGEELTPDGQSAQGAARLAQGEEPAPVMEPPGRVLAQGSDIALLRRRCAAAARAELDRAAAAVYPAAWRRFELDELAQTAVIDCAQGSVQAYPTVVRRPQAVAIRFEWSREEALRTAREGTAFLARVMLDRQARELAKSLSSDVQLLLAASPYLAGDRLVDGLLQLIFRRACFQDAEPPRTRPAFEASVEAGRARLYPAHAEVTAAARTWFTEARAVRRLLEDERSHAYAALAEETHEHLCGLLSMDRILSISTDWLRQLPRYIKAEERRWQRLLARGGEPAHIGSELAQWGLRARRLEAQVTAELRWIAQLDELRAWIEEYRVSLYAQELRTLGPVSAPRLAARAADIEAWLTR